MARIRRNFIWGVIDGNLAATGSTATLSSPGLQAAPTISGSDFMAIVIDPLAHFGDPEIVHLTVHTSGSSTGTITRGQEGTTQRLHTAANGVEWRHITTRADWDDIEARLAAHGI